METGVDLVVVLEAPLYLPVPKTIQHFIEVVSCDYNSPLLADMPCMAYVCSVQ